MQPATLLLRARETAETAFQMPCAPSAMSIAMVLRPRSRRLSKSRSTLGTLAEGVVKRHQLFCAIDVDTNDR